MAAQRARIGTELVELAARHRLVAFEVLGHLILLQAHCALVDFDAADVHADAVDRLAEHFEIPLVGIFTRWYAALRAVVGGRLAEAEAAIGTATVAVGAAEMPGLEHGLRALSLLCLRIQQGSPLDPDEPMDWGPYRRWTEPLVLLAAGRRTDAEAAAEAIPDAPRDLLYEARLCLAARTALAVDDRGAAQRIYQALLPAAAELAGAGSGVLTLGPVAYYLGELATYLGSPDDAERHYWQALEIAGKAEAPQWLDAAKDALLRLDPDSRPAGTGDPADRQHPMLPETSDQQPDQS
jgi:tetratricopeptide (TPR) repeat protein